MTDQTSPRKKDTEQDCHTEKTLRWELHFVSVDSNGAVLAPQLRFIGLKRIKADSSYLDSLIVKL